MRQYLAVSMIGQMLIQIPLLVVSGYLLGRGIQGRCETIQDSYNHNGIPGFLIALFTSFYWILPRSIDAALNSGWMELFKFVTVPLLIGLPLALSWKKIASIFKGFVWANVVSMCFVMGWLYVNAPVRLCNNYLTNQQVALGRTLMSLAIIVFVFFFLKIFLFDFQKTSNH